MTLYEVTAQPITNRDVILIAQNEDPREDPNITLWKSVIKQAVFDATFPINLQDLHTPHGRRMPEKVRRAINQQRIKVSAMYFLFVSDGDGDDIGSLQWICDHIGTHIDYERKKAREEIERAENDTTRKKYHKPKGTRRRVFHVVSGNAILGAAL